jgi:hypothetical protein
MANPYWISERESPASAERTVRRFYLTDDGRKFVLVAKVGYDFEVAAKRDPMLRGVMDENFAAQLTRFCADNHLDPKTVRPVEDS